MSCRRKSIDKKIPKTCKDIVENLKCWFSVSLSIGQYFFFMLDELSSYVKCQDIMMWNMKQPHLYLFLIWNEVQMQSQLTTHWGWVIDICVSKLATIGSDNGLSPGRRQAIIWTNAGMLLIGPLGTNFCEILIKIWLKKMHVKMSSGNWWPFCQSKSHEFKVTFHLWWSPSKQLKLHLFDLQKQI